MRTFLLIIDGPTGSGKTAAAEIVHKKFPRTALLGSDRIKWSVSGFRRDRRNNQMINRGVIALVRAFLVQKVNVIVEQPFSKGWVEKYQQLGKELNLKTITVQLAVPRDISLHRISERNKKPHPWGAPRTPHSRVLQNIRRHASKPPIQAHRIDSSSISPKQVAAEIERCVRKRQAIQS